jgi:hypothetical protein
MLHPCLSTGLSGRVYSHRLFQPITMHLLSKTPLLSPIPVVSVLRWLWSSILDTCRMRHEPTQLHSHTVHYPPQRVSTGTSTRSRLCPCHDVVNQLRAPRSPNALHTVLRWPRFRAQLRHRWAQYSGLPPITLYRSFGQLADRIRDAGDLLDDCVIGWDSLNEPSEGLVGYLDLHSLPAKQGSTLKRGPTPTPAQSLRLGMGQAQTVENWTFNAFGPKRTGMVTIDPKGLTIWLDPLTERDGVHPRYGWKRGPDWQLGVDIWAQHGVWDIETGYVMRPDYFRYLPSVEFAGPEEEVAEVEFVADYWAPHWQAWARRIRKAHPEAIHFVAPPVFAQPPPSAC